MQNDYNHVNMYHPKPHQTQTNHPVVFEKA